MRSRSRYRGSLLVALPYPYRELHQGRIGGTFLPADVMRRYLRTRRVPVRMVSGVDAHGTGVWLESRGLGVDPQTYVRSKARAYLRTLGALGIHPTRFINTLDPSHGRFVRRYLRALGSRIQSRVDQTNYCQGCGIQTNQRLLMDPGTGISVEKLMEAGGSIPEGLVCTLCKIRPVVRSLAHSWVEYNPQDLRVSQDHFPMRDLVQTSKNITRYLPWGVRTGVPHQVYYVWVEALLAYHQGGQGPYRFFYGKDNRYYHGVILRQLRTKGSPLSRRDNTYCRHHILSRGRKISTSQGGLTLVQEDLTVKRLALIISDPRTQDMEYGPDQLDLARKLIKNKFINLGRRIRGWFKARGVRSVILGDLKTGVIEQDYRKAMVSSRPARALDSCIAYHHLLTRELQTQLTLNPRESSLKFHLHRLDQLLQPLIPGWDRDERTRSDP